MPGALSAHASGELHLGAIANGASAGRQHLCALGQALHLNPRQGPVVLRLFGSCADLNRDVPDLLTVNHLDVGLGLVSPHAGQGHSQSPGAACAQSAFGKKTLSQTLFPGQARQERLVTDLGPVELGLGYRYYQHNNDLSALLNDSHEVGLSLATEVSGVTLGLAGYYDITNEGFYFEAKAAYEIKITESFSLVPAIGVGYAVDYNWQTIAPGLDGFTAVTASLSAPVKLAKNVTLTPYIAGNLPVDALDDAGEDSQLFGGVSLSVRF
jgi:hypothetical protein